MRSLGRALWNGLLCCEMGKSRNERSKNEGTFLENVKVTLSLLHQEVLIVKANIEELRVHSSSGVANDTLNIPHLHWPHFSAWDDPSYWMSSWCTQYADDNQKSWNVLAQEFSPSSMVLDRSSLLAHRRSCADDPATGNLHFSTRSIHATMERK